MRRPEVRLGASEEGASGLAQMLASLLEDNIRDFRTRAAAARLTRGQVVLRTSDSGIAVTLSFGPGQVVVEEGARAGTAMVEGEWIHMAALCSGQRSALAALASGELRLRRGHGREHGRGRGLLAAAGAGWALSVPRSFYGAHESAHESAHGSAGSWWSEHRAGLAVALGLALGLALVLALVTGLVLVAVDEVVPAGIQVSGAGNQQQRENSRAKSRARSRARAPDSHRRCGSGGTLHGGQAQGGGVRGLRHPRARRRRRGYLEA